MTAEPLADTHAVTSGYVAYAAVTAERDAQGCTRLSRLRSDGPLALRPTTSAAAATAVVHLVGAAAGPLAGDRFLLDIEVRAGARLEIRSVATTLALPGRRPGAESCFTVRAVVAPGGHLDFAPEPTIAAAGCRHRSDAQITLAEDATLRWLEAVVLGRHHEDPGRHTSRIDVTRNDVPLLRHELALDEPSRYTTTSVVGEARATGSLVLIGPGLYDGAITDDGMAVLPLRHSGVLVSAVAADALQLHRRLTAGEAHAGKVDRPDGTSAY